MKPFLKRPICIFLISYLSYMVVYIARLNLSMAISPLSEQGILSKTQTGLMGTVFFCVFAVGRLFNGALGDHVRPDRFIAAGLLIIGTSHIGLGLLLPPVYMIFLWGHNAYGQSMLWGALLKIMTMTYAGSDAEKKTSLLVTSTAAGSVAGIVMAMFAIDRWSVSAAFFFPGMLALAACAAVWFGMRFPDHALPVSRPAISPLRLLADRDVRPMLGPAILHGIIKDNLSLWMAIYFMERFGINLSATTVFVFAIPLTGLLGRLAYMPLFNRCAKNLNRTTGLSFVICGCAALLLSIRGIPPVVAAACLCVLSAAIMMVNTSILSIFPMRFADRNQVSGVSGFLDFFTYLGAGIGSLIYGLMVARGGYEVMYASWAVLCVLSIVLIYVSKKRSVIWEN